MREEQYGDDVRAQYIAGQCGANDDCDVQGNAERAQMQRFYSEAERAFLPTFGEYTPEQVAVLVAECRANANDDE